MSLRENLFVVFIKTLTKTLWGVYHKKVLMKTTKRFSSHGHNENPQKTSIFNSVLYNPLNYVRGARFDSRPG